MCKGSRAFDSNFWKIGHNWQPKWLSNPAFSSHTFLKTRFISVHPLAPNVYWIQRWAF
ncbi:unnamed protein product, partial [Onchocerca ochengi]|uniref:Uncharacterized protein n=1 Tax=Onchocerca ochengi TaxID=42157 RepID=A0A182EC72_ONCOC